jgi:hypothetical protein
MQQPDALDMVQVQSQVHRSRTSNLLERGCERPHRPAVEFHRVLADLQDRRRSRASAPAVIASACSSVMTLKAATPTRELTAVSRSSCVLTNVMRQPPDQLSRRLSHRGLVGQAWCVLSCGRGY